MDPKIVDVTEQKRLNDARETGIPWKKWGPYLSERQWGTVREDYSENGNAWNYFTHDQARSRAYRWGEDGLGGICDDKQRLCFALALWNERDPILKERLFGLTNSEANHGEDVKEYYFYLDSTPTHSYMKYLYKYPQREYPVPRPDRDQPADDHGKSSSTSCSTPASLTTTGTLTCSWSTPRRARKTSSSASPCTIVGLKRPGFGSCRPSGSATPGRGARKQPKPSLREVGPGAIQATHPELGDYWLYCDGAPELLFTENESNASRLWGQPNASPYVKDAFHEYIISGRGEAVNPAKIGTKAAAHYVLDVPGGGSTTVRLRLAAARVDDAFGGFERHSKAGSPTLTNSTSGFRRSR